MAAVRELDSLYFHYKHLLFSVCKAVLNLDCENGRVSVTLTTELDVMNNYDVVKKQKKRSPSYFRRLNRRKDERNLVNQKDQEAAKATESNDGANSIITQSPYTVTSAEEADDISESSSVNSEPIEFPATMVNDALVAAEKAGSDDVLQKVADSSTSVDAVQAIDWRDIEDPGERLRRRIEVEGVFLPIMNMCCLHYCIEKGGGKESCCDHECGALQPLL